MRNIVLYGAGITAEKFYVKNKEYYNIEFVIDQKIKHFHNLDVFTLEKVLYDLKNVYVVVTTGSENYLSIKTNLEAVGLKEYRNFIWVDMFEKKMALLYGNCHMLPIKAYLEAQPQFIKAYYIVCYRIGNDREREYPDIEELSYCSLFITQNIRDNNSRGVPGYTDLLKLLNPIAKTIIIPNLYGINLFFPQVMDKNASDNILQKHLNEFKNISQDNYEILCALSANRDVNIDRMAKAGKSKNEIIMILKDNNYYDEEYVKEFFNNGIEKLKQREKGCTIIISDWIIKNYKDRLLFYEPNHPTNELLIEIAKRCLIKLKIRVYSQYTISSGMDAREVFIYNSVKKCLDLKFEQKYIRNYSRYGSIDYLPMNLEDYIDFYLKWMF